LTVRLISPTKAFGFSNLYLDFLAGQAPASDLFVSPGYLQTVGQIDQAVYQHTQLVEILTRQNRHFGASPKTFEAIELLNDSRTVCFFAGQQAGLFGGPLLSLIKALATVKAAKRRSEELGRPVVPIFWIAADDHDFAEINNTYLLNRDGELAQVAYPVMPDQPVPVGDVRFADDAAVEAMHKLLQETLGQSDFTPALYAMLEECYSSGKNVVTAFGKLIAKLTADHGLILFSPADPAAKKLASPLFLNILARQSELHALLGTTNRRIEQASYHLQVEKNDQAVHLFYHKNGRWPIVHRDGRYHAGEFSFNLAELTDLIRLNPDQFSPDVLTRPLMQSFLFPTLAQMGGPSEIAYFAQINPLFALFNVPTPVHTARPTATLVEKRHEKVMAESDISFEDLAGDFELVINRVMAKSFPQDIETEFQKLREGIFGRFDQFTEKSLQFDPTLKDFAQQTAGKIDFSMKAFEGKVFGAHKKKSKELRDRLYRLWYALYPNRALQDRSLNISYFVSRYGPGVVSFLYDRIDPDQSAHQLISLSEYTN
jgi:bacillithiol biosynthesis cysteine-adding enzyme BshC